MLAELRIGNFAIIESLEVSFHKGLNILTGETGAGKSIIVDAVELLLGGRADTDVVRAGSNEAIIEGMFSLGPHAEALRPLKDKGIETSDDLILKRSIPISGKGRAYINGSLVTLSLLSEIGDSLVDIHGQHEHQTLLRQETHLDILDQAGNLEALRAEVGERAQTFLNTVRELGLLNEREKQRAQMEELLKFQSEEIASAHLKDGEEEELRSERQILLNAEKLHSLAQQGHEALYAREGSVSEVLSSVLKSLEELKKIDPSCSPLHENLSSSLVQAEEVGLSLRDYAGKISFDSRKLEAIESRLELLSRLKKKYGGTAGEVRKFHDRVRKELKDMETNTERIAECERLLKESGEAYLSSAKKLSGKRRDAARQLMKSVEEELATLGMKKTVFKIDLSTLPIPGPGMEVQGLPVEQKGIDRAEFLISPNVGEEPKPLTRIASGGELSRIMLALKTVFKGIPIMIFDEVDSGIGGATAEVVGRKLKEVSASHQVLCVTHLPQIAVYADAHFKVTKDVIGKRTLAGIKKLTEEERVGEISRMLAGMKITGKTREHAKEMLNGARG